MSAAVKANLNQKLPVRGPPLWEMAGVEPDEINPYAQASPAYEFDQRIAW